MSGCGGVGNVKIILGQCNMIGIPLFLFGFAMIPNLYYKYTAAIMVAGLVIMVIEAIIYEYKQGTNSRKPRA